MEIVFCIIIDGLKLLDPLRLLLLLSLMDKLKVDVG